MELRGETRANIFDKSLWWYSNSFIAIRPVSREIDRTAPWGCVDLYLVTTAGELFAVLAGQLSAPAALRCQGKVPGTPCYVPSGEGSSQCLIHGLKHCSAPPMVQMLA